MLWRVQVNVEGAAGMTKTEVNNAVRVGFHQVGVYWHQNFRKKHFSAVAFTEYGYQARSKKYWYRKLKKTGQALPLVFTGKSRARSESATISETVKQVKVAMDLPTLNLRPKGGRINMAEEMRTISPREHEQLEKVMAASLRDTFRSQRNRIKIVIGG